MAQSLARMPTFHWNNLNLLTYVCYSFIKVLSFSVSKGYTFFTFGRGVQKNCCSLAHWGVQKNCCSLAH